jgi:alcohol dehydrogenase class IV
MAECVAVLAAQPAPVAACLRDPTLVTAARGCALVLLPTTAGSGSELTRFATVYLDGCKYSLDRDQVRADLVLVDPELTRSLPLAESVASGLDALSHAVESYWSVAATADSRALAFSALERLVPALAEAAAAASFDEPRRRAELAHGAALAGAAIDVTRTTAAHALSYELTSRLGLPHGTAVALHLRWLMRRHAVLDDADCRHPEGAAAVRRRVERVQRLARDCRVAGVPDPAAARAGPPARRHPRAGAAGRVLGGAVQPRARLAPGREQPLRAHPGRPRSARRLTER